MPYTGPYNKILYGRDFNYFKRVTSVTAGGAAFATDCDVMIPISTQALTFNLESGSFIEYSFNGNTVHGDMTAGLASANLKFDNRVVSKIWFRGTGIIRVEAWAIR